MKTTVAAVWLLYSVYFGARGLSLLPDVISALFLFWSALIASGAIQTLLGGKWGPSLLHLSALFSLGYGGAFWFVLGLLGGLPNAFACAVTVLMFVSLWTLITLRRNQ